MIMIFILFLIAGCGMDYKMDYQEKDYEPIDTTPPTVLSIRPYPDEKNVPLESVIWIKFSEPVLSETVNPLSFSLQSKTERISGTFIFSDDMTEFSFLPSESLKPETQYTITINNRITDLGGNSLADQDPNDKIPATPFVSSFTTFKEDN